MALVTPHTGIWASNSHVIWTGSLADSANPYTVRPQGGNTTYPTADLAIYAPVRVRRASVVKKLWASITTASGNVDIGLYNAGGTRLVSAGSTAAALGLVVDVTDTTIGPGLYYLAFVSDSVVLAMTRSSNTAPAHAAMGYLTEQLSASQALPATATWAMPQTLAYAPSVAVVLETTLT